MALMNRQLLIQITLIAAILAVGSSNPNVQQGPQNWNFGFNYTNEPFRHPKPFQNSRRVIVGGSDNWRFGFNYTEWARTNAPFYFNDTLGFSSPKGSGRGNSVKGKQSSLADVQAKANDSVESDTTSFPNVAKHFDLFYVLVRIHWELILGSLWVMGHIG
ncbi:hypothetical protein Tco_1350843 [Tanacetum coccineum]